MREISYSALPGDDGREIKRVARGNLGLSHRLFTSLKQKDALLLDGVPVHANAIVRAGQTVSVRTRDVTDGWVEVTASGADVTAVQGDLFEFVMPEHAVDVRVRFAWEDLS